VSLAGSIKPDQRGQVLIPGWFIAVPAEVKLYKVSIERRNWASDRRHGSGDDHMRKIGYGFAGVYCRRRKNCARAVTRSIPSETMNEGINEQVYDSGIRFIMTITPAQAGWLDEAIENAVERTGTAQWMKRRCRL